MVYLRCLIVTVGSEAKREGGGKMSSARSCEGSAAVALRCREAEACNSCNLYTGIPRARPAWFFASVAVYCKYKYLSCDSFFD